MTGIPYKTTANSHVIQATAPVRMDMDGQHGRDMLRPRKKNLRWGWTREQILWNTYGIGVNHLKSGLHYQGRIAIWVGRWQFVRLLRTTQRDTPTDPETSTP